MTRDTDEKDADQLIAEDMARRGPTASTRPDDSSATDGTTRPAAPARPADSSAIGGTTFAWRNLSDEDAPAAWAKLREWVEWFTVRYNIPLTTVPVCWWRHPVLVEELSALHIAHVACFHTADTGYGPISWHERLTLAHPRLARAYAGGCTRGHTETRPRDWEGVTDETAWAAWTTNAHAHRDAPASHQREEEE